MIIERYLTEINRIFCVSIFSWLHQCHCWKILHITGRWW